VDCGALYKTRLCMGLLIPVLPFVETGVLCHHVQTFAWLESTSST
jgi:hypothetical protein